VAERPPDPEAPASADEVPEGVILDPGGPMLVDGPVDLTLPDGTHVCSDRPVVALCTCRRSKRYPFCDTSHRARSRPGSSSED
jgi:CDGSH-type Zn-finger protein